MVTLNEVIGYGVAALCASLIAYAALRWRREFACLAYRARSRSLGFYPGLPLPWLKLAIVFPYRAHLVGMVVVGLAFGMFGAMFWACFVGGTLAALRGEVALGTGRPEAPMVRPPWHVLGVFVAIGGGLLYGGIRALLDPREAARYYEWAMDTSAPLDVAYPTRGAAVAVPPRAASVRLVKLWGVFLGACGLGVLALGLLAFWPK